MEGILKGILRLLATIIGLVGAVIALVVNGAHSLISDAEKLSGGTGRTTHGFLGILVFIVALVGALLSWPAPVMAAVLMVLASIGLYFIVGGAAFFAIPFLLVAAVLDYLDRRKGAPAK